MAKKKAPPKSRGLRAAKPNPNKRNASSFKKGNVASVGNQGPKGMAQYDAEELAARVIDKRMVSRYLTVNAHLTKHQAREKLNTGQCSLLEGMVLRAMLRTYYNGDVGGIDFFFDRLIGKVPNKVEHVKSDPYEGKTLEELMEMRQKLNEQNLITLRQLEQSERVKQQERQVIEITANAAPSPAPSPGGDDKGN